MCKAVSKSLQNDKRWARADVQTEIHKQQPPANDRHQERSEAPPQDIYRNLRNILSASMLPNQSTVLSEIEAAEKLGNCIIDFQI